MIEEIKELGLIGPDPKDERDYQLAEIQPEAVVLPEEYDLREGFSEVGRQNYGTCTSWGSCGLKEWLDNKEYDRKINLSEKFVYYNTKVISGLWDIEGDYGRNALKALCEKGAPLLADYPDYKDESWEKYVKTVPSPEMYKKAEEFKGLRYWAVGKTLEDFKQAQFQQKSPVAFGMEWFNSYRIPASDGRLPLPSNSVGGHWICTAGWTKGKFWFRNSHDKSWGVNGYAYIPFEEFEKHNIWNAWILLDAEKSVETTGWVASKYLRRTDTGFDVGDNVAPIYRLNLRKEPTVKAGKIITLKIGQKCQVVADGVDADGYTWHKIKVVK